MRRMTLALQVFLSILSVSLVTTVVVGYFARRSLSSAFENYLATLPSRPGRGMGRMMLGSAEAAFVASVDRGVVIAAIVVMLGAALLAAVLATYLIRPLRRLESAANAIAAGDFSQRVAVEGAVEIAALGDSFNSMASSLDAAEAARRRLVADVAHELRNPLAAARAQAEAMADGLRPADNDSLGSLVEDIEHLSALVEDLQLLASAEAGRLAYRMSTVDLAALAEKAVGRVSALVRNDVTVRVDADRGRVTIIGDETRLLQVVDNLLSNAVRHTSSGTITVAVSQDDDGIRLSVTDTGEGMTEKDLASAFERFYRADSARSTESGGVGLGLAIARAIVHDHGGEVFATSEPGRGTTVGFVVPATAALSTHATQR